MDLNGYIKVVNQYSIVQYFSVRVRVEDGTSDRLPGSPSAAPEALVMYTGGSPVDWGELSPKLKAVHSMFGCGQIKLLVAQSFKDDSTRLEAQEWAVDEGLLLFSSRLVQEYVQIVSCTSSRCWNCWLFWRRRRWLCWRKILCLFATEEGDWGSADVSVAKHEHEEGHGGRTGEFILTCF